MKTNGKPRDRPNFYSIIPNVDGTVDVHLRPEVTVYDVCGVWEYDVRVIIVRGINPCDPVYCGDLESHIRAHFAAWCQIGEVIYL